MANTRKTPNICAQRRKIEKDAERLKKQEEALARREAAAREKAKKKAEALRERHKKEAAKLDAKHRRELAALEKTFECAPARPRQKGAKRKAAKKTAKKADDGGSGPAASASLGPRVSKTARPAHRVHDLIEDRDDQELVDTMTSWDGAGRRPLSGAEEYRARLVATDAERARMPTSQPFEKPGHRDDFIAGFRAGSAAYQADPRVDISAGERAYDLVSRKHGNSWIDGYAAAIDDARGLFRQRWVRVAHQLGLDHRQVAPSPSAISEDDIPFELAKRAYAGTSHTPDVRAKGERRRYVETFTDLRRRVEEAGGDIDAFEDFRRTWLKRYRELLGRRSGLMSTLVTGRGNFPVRSQKKKSDAYDRALREFIEWAEKRQRKLLGRGRPEGIRSTDDDAIEKLREKLRATEERRELARKANVILRNKKKTADQKQAELVALGLPRAEAAQRLRLGNLGTYTMANFSGEIRRIKQRIEGLQDLEEKKARGGFEPYKRGPWTIEWDDEDGRVRVTGPKPATREATRQQSAKFKARGFRWSPRNSAYQRQATENAWYAAQNIVDEIAGAAEAA